MDPFIPWIAGIGSICLGVMVLSIFFTLLSAIQRRFAKPATVKLKGLLKDSEWLNLHLSGSKTLNNVRFIGFTDGDSMKGIPYHFHNMAVFENAQGKRILLRADTIRMMEEISAEAPDNQT